MAAHGVRLTAYGKREDGNGGRVGLEEWNGGMMVGKTRRVE
jgi:hypothetical protein